MACKTPSTSKGTGKKGKGKKGEEPGCKGKKC